MDIVYVGSGVVVVLCIFYAVCRWIWSAMNEELYPPSMSIEPGEYHDEHEEIAEKLPERRKHIPLEESMVELNKACEEAERARKESLND